MNSGFLPRYRLIPVMHMRIVDHVPTVVDDQEGNLSYDVALNGRYRYEYFF
jgi:hypothetical protein